MMWLTWRQYRTSILVALGALAALTVILLLTGPGLAHLYSTTVATCRTHNDCSTAKSAFLLNDADLQTGLEVLVVVAPGILGVFWGAPLIARELETGTYRLAWTQSVTRTRWLSVKLGVIGLSSMAVAGLLSLMVTWWSIPFDTVNLNIFGTFDERDIVPIGYAAFAFALGVLTGLLLRRTVPAMAVTSVAFTAARLAFSAWLRPLLIAPVHRTLALTAIQGWSAGTEVNPVGPSYYNTLIPGPTGISNVWIYSTEIVDKAGHLLTSKFVANACPLLHAGGSGGPQTGTGRTVHVPAAPTVLPDCVVKVGRTFRAVVTYQPASRYWAFQWYELAIFTFLALLLAGICVLWVRGRMA